MWEWNASHSLVAVLFGGVFGHLTRDWGKIQRKAFAIGCVTCLVIWLLCWIGEILIPPLAALRIYCGERIWIIGKLLLGLLALPVGFPVSYCFSRRWLLQRADKSSQETDQSVGKVLDPAHNKARKVQLVYEIVMGVILWGWFWFLTPARDWIGQDDQQMFTQVIALLLVWCILIFLLVVLGGRIINRHVEYHLRHRR